MKRCRLKRLIGRVTASKILYLLYDFVCTKTLTSNPQTNVRQGPLHPSQLPWSGAQHLTRPFGPLLIKEDKEMSIAHKKMNFNDAETNHTATNIVMDRGCIKTI